MNTVVRCSRGHQWEVRSPGGDEPPQLACPVCGARVEGLVEKGTLTEVVNEPTIAQLPVARFTASPAATPTATAAPRRMGNFEILEVLGRGGMGIVYKAYQPELRRVVALKMILEGAGDDTTLARFRTEAAAIAQLQHPNITQIHEIGEHEGRKYLSLEYVEGGTLTKRLARGLPLAREAARCAGSRAPASTPRGSRRRWPPARPRTPPRQPPRPAPRCGRAAPTTPPRPARRSAQWGSPVSTTASAPGTAPGRRSRRRTGTPR